MPVTVVNMIPKSLSGERQQDSEPNIAVNPENPLQIVGTAFTPDPLNGPRAPIFVSNDGGATWSLRMIVPGGPATADISVGFAGRGGALYAGTLNFTTVNLNVLRTANPFAVTPMTTLVNRPDEDQPWVSAATAGTGAGRDRVYVGHNNFNAAPRTASVEVSRNARTAPAPAGFASRRIERRGNAGQDGPPVRTAVHPDGTVYAAFHRWVRNLPSGPLDFAIDVVVVRDDDWGGGTNPFRALVDPGDNVPGRRIAKNRFVRFTASTGPLGQERIGADLAVAVDPRDSDRVWVAWCDRVDGATGTDWTVHVRRSNNRGQTWGNDRRTITNAKNPALAVNAQGVTALMFQQLRGTGAARRWVTVLELTKNAWQTPPTRHVLHTALASQPPRQFLPYLGDYIRLLSVGDDFYGVFSGSNLPDTANFPSGITYQRNANWTTHTLLRTDNSTPVPVSIDPFFVHHTP
jgi:hypothetical protein